MSTDSLKNLKIEEVKRLEVLSKIGKKINTPESFSEALQAVLDSVVESLEAERGALFLHSQAGELPSLKLWVDHSNESLNKEFRYSTTVVEKVWKELQPLAEVDAQENESLASLNSIKAQGIRSVICVPLIGRESNLGVLYLDNRISSAFTKADLQMLDVIADLAATALERARFFDALQDLNEDLEARVVERTTEAESARQEAERATKAKSLFLAKMSHELRTPVNGVLGLTEDLARREQNPALRLQLDQVVKSARSLTTLINGVLDFSKLESENMVCERHRFCLEEAVTAAISTINYQAKNKGLELQVWIGPNCPEDIYSDSIRFKQILINLLSNAVKFTQEGWVRLILTSPQSDLLKVSVSDSGVGIPKEKRDEIFKPFAQVDASTTRQFGGTGLGLAICRSLCSLLGGELSVESEPGEGAKFFFQIPIEVAQAFSKPDFEGLPVHLQVDSTAQRQALERLLGGWSCQVVKEISEANFVIGNLRAERNSLPGIILVEPGEALPSDQTFGETERPVLTPVTRGLLASAMKSVLNGSSETSGEKEVLPQPPPDSLVLVAEDHEINRLVIQKMLSEWGYDCCFASDGTEALEVFAERKPRLVLLDIEMPGKDGFETAACLRQDASSRGVPILAVTAHLSPDLRKRCLSAGMDDILSKPISRSSLGGRLARWEAVLEGRLDYDVARFSDSEETENWPSELQAKLASLLTNPPETAPTEELRKLCLSLGLYEGLAPLLDWDSKAPEAKAQSLQSLANLLS